MKTNRTLNLWGVGLVALNLALLPTVADTSVDTRAIHTALSKVSAPEMGSKAAELVRLAPAKHADAITKEVVLASIKISPATAVAVVGSIAKENAQAAPLAAGTAASKMPKLAAAIAKAAAAAAPTQAGKIVQAVCSAVPKEYKAVALTVAQLVPTAGKEILQGIAAAVPTLRAYLASAESSYPQTGVTIPVAAILQQAEVASLNSTTSATGFEPVVSPPPSFGPPFLPLGGTPTETYTTNSSNVPPGGRNYSGP